jgi:hypothetical protein
MVGQNYKSFIVVQKIIQMSLRLAKNNNDISY